MTTGQILLAAFIIIVLISIDVFMVGFSYGIDKVKVSNWRLVVISLVGNIVVCLVLIFSSLISDQLSEAAIEWTAFSLFMLIGLYKLTTWYVGKRKSKKNGIDLHTKAEKKQSWKEAILLGLVLAIDGVGAGFAIGFGLTLIFIFSIIAISFIVDILLFKVGQFVGAKIADKSRIDLGWLPGIIFMCVAGLQFLI